MKVSIVSAYINQVAMTKDWLENLKDKLPNEVIELVLVNAGNSEDLTFSDNRFKLVKLDKNVSFSNSMNNGIINCSGDFIIVMGNDVFPTSNTWVEELLKCYEDTKAFISCPTPNNPSISCYNHLIKRVIDESYTEYNMFPAICWGIPKIVIDKVGLFNEDYLIGCYEDNDYCDRVLNSGGSIVVTSKVLVNHGLSQELKLLDPNNKYFQVNSSLYNKR